LVSSQASQQIRPFNAKKNAIIIRVSGTDKNQIQREKKRMLRVAHSRVKIWIRTSLSISYQTKLRASLSKNSRWQKMAFAKYTPTVWFKEIFFL
jgi:hypothetical protein